MQMIRAKDLSINVFFLPPCFHFISFTGLFAFLVLKLLQIKKENHKNMIFMCAYKYIYE